MKNAVIYARSASFNEDSLRTQIVLCKKFAADNGYTVVRIFADNNASGRSAKRPALQKLLKDINSCWETIIILDHSRFFREPHKYIEYMQRLNFAGKRLITAIEQKEALVFVCPQTRITRAVPFFTAAIAKFCPSVSTLKHCRPLASNSAHNKYFSSDFCLLTN